MTTNDKEPIRMSNGSLMNPESVKRSDEKWTRSHQGRVIANRKNKARNARQSLRSNLRILERWQQAK